MLTHTPVGSALRLAKGTDGGGAGGVVMADDCIERDIVVLAFVFELHNLRSILLNSVLKSLHPLSHSVSCPVTLFNV